MDIYTTALNKDYYTTDLVTCTRPGCGGELLECYYEGDSVCTSCGLVDNRNAHTIERVFPEVKKDAQFKLLYKNNSCMRLKKVGNNIAEYWKEVHRYQKGLGATVPQEVVDKVRRMYIRYKRGDWKVSVTSEQTRAYLRRLRYSKYYEREPQITSRVIGKDLEPPTNTIEETLEEIWQRCRVLWLDCPKELRKHRKKNFVNYRDFRRRALLMMKQDTLALQNRRCTTKKTTEQLNEIFAWFASCNKGEPLWKEWRRGILPILARRPIKKRR
jgi:hypothetical protein